MKKLSTRQRTENLLKHVPETRSDDKLLCVLFMQKSGLGLTDEQVDKFFKMDDLWNVRRYRQKMQEQGLYPPSTEVGERRYKKYKRVRGQIASQDSKTHEEILENLGYVFADD